MTPKQKAKELFDKYSEHFCAGPVHDKFHSKQGALIAVDEVLYNGRLISPLLFTNQQHGETYWQEVKKEITEI